jgi:NAD(P)H-dependent FMN reductase
MKKIITIGGSNSKNSITKQLAEYTGKLIHNVVVEKIDLNDFEMPLFSVDVENELSFPKAAKELHAIFDQADGFVVSLAEHNGSYSVAFKNIFDWLSRIEGKVWRDKPMILLSTSPGERGGQTVLEIALARFPYMGANIIGSISLGSFFDNFIDGELVNDAKKEELKEIISDFEKAI